MDRERDWGAVRASKEAHWRSLTAAQRLRLADELRLHALLLHPDWPTAPQRRADIEHHSQVSERIARASSSCER